MKILVTGCAGYIGGHLCDALSRRGHVVYGVDQNKILHRNLRDSKVIDLGIPNPFQRLVWDVDIDLIIHLAAQTDVENSIIETYNDAHSNIMATINVLDLAVKASCPIIYISSAAIYGIDGEVDETITPAPTSPYGLSKLIGEKYVKMYHDLYGLSYLIYRLSNVYGLDNSKGVVHNFINRCLSGMTMQIRGNGSQVRDFIYIDDVIDAITYVIDNNCYCENDIYNVSTGAGITINDLANNIISLTQEKIIDPAIKYTEADNGILVSVLKNDKIKHDLGWSPQISLIEGLERSVSYTRHQLE